MATIVTRAGKGSALTWTEGDANFTNLNDDKLENIVEDITPQLGGNLDVNGNSIVSTTNGDIVLAPNGTGLVSAQADLVVGYGTSAANISSLGAYDLVLSTNEGTTSGTITIADGANGTISLTPNGTGVVSVTSDLTVSGSISSGANNPVIIAPNGTGDVHLNTDSVRIGDNNANATIATHGTGDLILTTNEGSGVEGIIRIFDGANGNITITPNGTGMTMLNNIEYHEKIHSLGTTSGTITPDVANGNVQTITLNGNLTFSAFSNPVAGQSLTLIINTNGTGRTLTSTMLFAGGSKTLSTTSTIDVISVFYNGTTYYASLAKDFK